MDNGYEEEGKLTKKFSELGLGFGLPGIFTVDPSSFNNNDSSLSQVMKAVEAAETTIKQQVEENNRLRADLQRKTFLLDKYKLDESMSQSSRPVGPWSELVHGSYEAHQSVPSVGNQQDNVVKSMGNTSPVDPAGILILHHDLKQFSDAAVQSHADTYSGNNEINGTMKGLLGDQHPADTARLSSASASSSQGRFQMEGDSAPRFNQSEHGLMPMAEADKSRSLWKQDLILKIREHEEEIFQLRTQLADYSIKEAQIRSEKHVLEKRIAYMRLAFDQQQQDLVDAASKALSYRQDIIEENIRLTYQLQDIQQERSTFVSYLLPLLAEYSLQPPVLDAQSIASNIKVLFKHLQEKLLLTESKLKESQYQLSPWRSDNHSNTVSHSPSYSVGGMMATTKNVGLELVPQPTYSHGKEAVSSTNAHTATEWDILVRQQGGFGGIATENSELDDVGKYSPLASRRTSATQVLHEQHPVTQGDGTMAQYHGETTNRQVKFRDPVSNSEMDDQDIEGNQNEREASANWSSGDPPYTRTLEELSPSYSPYLPPVLEEPSSSFSEAADDDPLPAIEALQISGDTFPGRELQACGYSINGTTSCNFEWVRNLPDGSVNYIEGAKQPNYLITADDVDTYLAIEVQPLDNRKRKGELVTVFANDRKKITCDPVMQSHIEKTLYSGHASYKVLLSMGYLDIWEHANLTIKRDACSIKCSGSSGIVITEKFSPTTSVTIPYGSPSEFILTGSSGVEQLLKADNCSDVACSRDTIVLTLRLFILRAGERRKGKKKGIFFNK